jgi:hypothetical protein
MSRAPYRALTGLALLGAFACSDEVISFDATPLDGGGAACGAQGVCGVCLGTAGCGWCIPMGRCMAGGTAGSNDGTCMGTDWDMTGRTCTPAEASTMDAAEAGGCFPIAGAEVTNALCSDGVDDDCNGAIDCGDPSCHGGGVTVCLDAGMRDSGVRDAGVDVPRVDSGGVIGPMGGTVSLMHFGVFGDVRPMNPNQTPDYPTMVITEVMDGMSQEHAEFAVATGDYMFADYASTANAQLELLVAAETHFVGHIFHALGNHECTGADNSNCPLGNETPQVQAYRTHLGSAYATLYYDWTVHTSVGDAHFIVTAPNGWDSTQSAWLTRMLAVSARYTFVVAHEPPTAQVIGPGSAAIETAMRARTGGVTLRLYGHTHEYRRINPNGVVSGNAGAPLYMPTDQYGFVMVDQRADGNIIVTAYNVGRPPTVNESWVVTPSGTATH